MINAGVIQRIGLERDQAIDARGMRPMRGGQVNNQTLFTGIFAGSHADGTNTIHGKRRLVKRPQQITLTGFLS